MIPRARPITKAQRRSILLPIVTELGNEAKRWSLEATRLIAANDDGWEEKTARARGLELAYRIARRHLEGTFDPQCPRCGMQHGPEVLHAD